MNKKELMKSFISELKKKKMSTLFIKNIFDYENFNDYNYIFRMKDNDNSIIIDIYDNISINRFNRYIFSFSNGKSDISVTEEYNIYIYFIYVLNVDDSEDKLKKLAHLFRIPKSEMIEYAKTFLYKEIVDVLNKLLRSCDK